MEQFRVCDICGVYDRDWHESYRCVNGHSVCSMCSNVSAFTVEIAIGLATDEIATNCLDKKDVSQLKGDILKMSLNKDKGIANRLLKKYGYYDNVSPEYCCACSSTLQIHNIQYRDIALYLASLSGLTIEELMDDLDSKFDNYSELHKFINKNSQGGD